MEDKEKIIITIVCSILVIVMIICFSLFGGGKKEEPNNNENTKDQEEIEEPDVIDTDPVIVNLNPTTKAYEVTSTKTISNLNSIINNAKFINNNSEDSENNYGMIAKIKEDSILIDKEDKVFILNTIKDAKAIRISVLSAANLYPIQLYILTENNELYNLLIYEDETCTLNKYNIANIESFAINTDRLDNTEWWRNFIIIKTTENKYYTDYQFSETKNYDYLETIELTEIK